MSSQALPHLTSRDSQLGPGSGSDLLLSIAPIMFGLIWNWFLMGTLMVQVYYYHLTFSRDPKILKALVYIVFLCDLAQTGLTTHTAYYTFVEHYTNAGVLNDPARTIIAQPLFDGIIGALVQGFYAWRIWQLGKNHTSKVALFIILGAIIAVASLQTVSAMTFAFSYVTLQQHPIDIFNAKINKCVEIWLASGMTVDTIIAFTMSYLVLKARGTTPCQQSVSILTKILVRIVATGVLTAFCAMIGLIAFVRFLKTDLYETPGYILGKLFSNALLVNLNVRSGGIRGDMVDLNTSLTNSDFTNTNRSLTFASSSKVRRPFHSTSSHGSSFTTREAQPRIDDLAAKDVLIASQSDSLKLQVLGPLPKSRNDIELQNVLQEPPPVQI